MCLLLNRNTPQYPLPPPFPETAINQHFKKKSTAKGSVFRTPCRDANHK